MSETTAGYTVTVTMKTEYDYDEYFEGSDYYSLCDSRGTMDFSRMFITVLYSLVFILGLIGNVLVVCVLVKHRNQTTLTDICLFNLALSDLLFIIMLPLYTDYTVVKNWTHGDLLCHFAGGFQRTGFFCSIFILVVMTLDRYMVIIHGTKVAKYRTMRTGVALTVVVWSLSLCVSLPAFIFTKETKEPNGPGCRYEPENKAWKVYNISANNILGLVLPLMVMILCYSRIIPVLMRIRSSKKQRVVKLIVSIMVVFFLLWTPYNISHFLIFLQSDYNLIDDCDSIHNVKLSLIVSETLAFTHCCWNPIIYAFVGQKFIRRVYLLLSSWVPGIKRSRRDSSNSFSRRSSAASRSSESTLTM
ncbi:C-C chemokine receptor type 1-like [Dunckerocampus dactyliophorus]|uniref:C-C chemokine receptor type 1-like n=1 Tax=Dunckerocampus dactyliophorus TaxID=161453 RepID=UPI002406C2E6|nr:C-C chemokine receptor type 1-like [Dunckerocampus dactyliophorus]